MKSERNLALQVFKGLSVTTVGFMMRMRMKSVLRMLLCATILTLHSSLFVACSESDDDPDEYEDWQIRNDIFFASLEDSLAQGNGAWKKLKSFAKNPSTSVGSNTDYIYYKVIKTGYEIADTVSPLYNDSVCVSYVGRQLPTTSYPEGYIFDSTVFGPYDLKTNATKKFKVSQLVDGFATAMLYMHRYDTWRIYIPYALGYGSTTSGSIRAYSTLIFDVTLYDFAEEGHAMPSQVGLTK